MDLDDFIMTVFCRIDDLLPQVTGGQRVRERGPQATLADSEVLTMEVVGEYLGLGQEQALFAYFRRHYAHFFPALRRLHRTTVERQAANLWALKERLWLRLLLQTPHDPTLGLLDSFPVPVCGFARAPRCRRFRGEAGYGRDPITRVWARDRWHFGNRLLRKVLMHTLCVALNIELNQPPLRLAQLVAA